MTDAATGTEESTLDTTTAGTGGFVRTVLDDRIGPRQGAVYAHEHLIIDSPLIESAFPHIHLDSVEDAVAELAPCAAAGVRLVLDAMPCAAGRDVQRLAEIARRSGISVIATTGLHHRRYYGPRHWSAQLSEGELADLFVADLTVGVDGFDYTGPTVRRTAHRAGVAKAATSGAVLDERDKRVLAAVAEASVRTGAPVLTHCENGSGALAQIGTLTASGVPPEAIILSHVDKAADLGYLREVAQTGAVLECDQALRQVDEGPSGFTVKAIAALVEDGFGTQIVVGTDGARRTLWSAHGGKPGLAYLARELPSLLRGHGIDTRQIDQIMGRNAVAALTWRQGEHASGLNGP